MGSPCCSRVVISSQPGPVSSFPSCRRGKKIFWPQKVGGFRWPAERARDGDVETILASSSAAASTSSLSVSGGGEGSKSSPPPNILPARSMKHHEQAAETKINSARERRRQPALLQQQQQQRQLGQVAINTLSARSRTSTCSIVTGSSTQRSDSTCAPSCGSSADSYSSRRSRSRSSASSAGDSHNEGGRSSRSGSSTSTGHRTRPATSYGVSNEGAIPPTSNTAYMQQLSHRSGNSRSNGRENRLRPPKILGQDTPTPSTTPKLPRFRVLDPVFDKHHKYDMVAEERAAQGGEVTGRFGPVHGSSVLAASLLTSELSTPWSHVLRGQKW